MKYANNVLNFLISIAFVFIYLFFGWWILALINLYAEMKGEQ